VKWSGFAYFVVATVTIVVAVLAYLKLETLPILTEVLNPLTLSIDTIQ
jgi:hypothetical protein